MPDKTLTTLILTAIGSIIMPAFLGGFGGGARYLHSVMIHKEDFHFGRFLIYTFVGIFGGVLIHLFMHESLGSSFSGVVLLAGLLSKEIITMIEQKGIPKPIKKLFE